MDSNQGWAWVSDEPFGWATQHYGGWALLVGHGWTWIPRVTWAPAWVAWRRNDDCVGWAPLPPETLYAAADVTYGPEVEADCGLTADWYTFMPVRHFDEPVARYCRPLVENSHFFGLTAGVTQIVVRRDHIVCGGPEPRWINGWLARPMPRHSIHHRREWHDQRDYRPRFADTPLSCYSPRVRADWNDAIRPHRTHGRLDNVRVVRREESFRRELARHYHGERDQRRARALVAMKAEPARRLAKRHEELERIRAGHAVAESRQNERSERGESVAGRPRGQKPPTAAPGASKAGPPKGPRDRREIAARIEDKRRAHDDKERPDPPRRPEARPQAQRPEQARGEAAERQQAAQAKQRAEQARSAQEHHEAKRRTQDQEAADRRREAAESQKAAEIKVRAERTRRAEAEQRGQQQEESRREAAERQRAAEERSRTDESRRARGREASERRQKEEAHPRVQRANEERERNKN